MSSKKSSFNNGCKIEQSLNSDLAYIFNHYSLIAKNRFTWKNLPNGIESRHIEKGLFEHGQVSFFDDDTLGLLCLPCSPSAQLNVYGDSNQFTITGIGYSKQISLDNMTRILNNDNALPTSKTIYRYAEKLARLEKTMELNEKQQRFPFIIPTTKDNHLTMKNLFKKMDEGENAIYVDEKLSHSGDVGIKAIKTESPFLLHDLQQHKNEVTNELLTFLGINNLPSDKKERLLVDEVNINNGHILMNLDLEYKNRLKACEEINAKFGLNISVEKTINTLENDFNGKKKEVQINV